MKTFETEIVAIESLQPHPRNYREHPDDQLEHIIESIKEYGFYRNVVVSSDNVILAGHGVVQAATKMGLEDVPVVRVESGSTEPKALKLLAADNTVSHLAEDNDRVLTELLKELSEDDDLLGTGYDDQMLAALVMVTRPASELANFDAAAEWVGMPEAGRVVDPLRVVVSFDTKDDRASFFEALGFQPPTEKTKSMWYPPKEKDDISSIEFVSTEN